MEMANVLNKLYSNNRFTESFLSENGVFSHHGTFKVNHGLASGLLFLNKAEKVWSVKGKGLLMRPFMLWAGAAMALHSLKVPGSASGRSISMEMDPLSYLLMICDEIQVWDRERPDASVSRSPFRESHLASFNILEVGARTCIDCLIECVPYRDVRVGDGSYDEARKLIQKGLEGDSRILSNYVNSATVDVKIRRRVRGLDNFVFGDVQF